jgi:outer membrane protein assembly factor BamD
MLNVLDRLTALPPYRPTALRLIIFCCATILAATACGNRLDPSLYPTADALYEVSMAAFERGDCGDAEIGFQRLSYDLSVRDPRRAVVRFYLAECHFRGKRYLEAAREFRRVADEHAQDSIAPRALFRAGDSNSRLWRRSELDATYGMTAITVYSEVLTRYPESAAAAEAREQIGDLNEKFAGKAYDTGIFYFRLKAYDSAIIYFKAVVADYPQTSFASEALLQLVEAYERIGYEEDKQDMCLQLRRYYPESVVEAPSCVSDTTST